MGTGASRDLRDVDVDLLLLLIFRVEDTRGGDLREGWEEGFAGIILSFITFSLSNLRFKNASCLSVDLILQEIILSH